MQAVPSEFLDIDRKERVNKPFFDLNLRTPDERTCDFDGVVIEFTPEQAMVQAARCIHCPDPAPCMQACPLNNDIPSAMWLIEQGRFVEAANLYHQTSSLRMRHSVRAPARSTNTTNPSCAGRWKHSRWTSSAAPKGASYRWAHLLARG
jgi:ferredoxin